MRAVRRQPLRKFTAYSIMEVVMSKNLVGKSIPALLLGLLLTGCGGGGGSTAATTNPPASNSISLSGTAAVGFPIVGATVSVTCAAGPAITGIANTSATGAWSTTASGQTLPCVVSVTGGTTNNVNNTTTYQSIANGAGIVNVTPLTSLVVANLIGSSTATPTSAQLATITQAQINTSIANVQTALGATLPSTINPITTAFTPTGGVVMDDVLTAMANAMTSSGTTYAALLSSSASAAPGAAITPPTGYSTALVTAYAGTTSGSTGTGGGGTLPVAPTVGTPVVVGSASINLSWPAVSGATSYNVYRSTSPSVSITPANRVATSYVSIVFMDTGLSAATTYYYKVTAINAAGEGAGSVEVSAITNAAAGADTSAPTGLTATVASDTQVNLSWNAVPGATQYIVSRSTTPGMAALLASNAVSMTAATTANITGLSAATTYYFAVQSTTPGSVASAEVSATTTGGTPIAPISVTTSTGPNQSYLSWSNVTDARLRFYYVYRSTVAGSVGSYLGYTTPATTTFADYGLLPNTQYFYTITGKDAWGVSLATSIQTTATTTSPVALVVGQMGGAMQGTALNIAPNAGVVTTILLGPSRLTGNPEGITTDGVDLYVADNRNNMILKHNIATGALTVLAGNGSFSSVDGTGSTASFKGPKGITTDGTNLYVAEVGGHVIRKIAISTGVVTTLAGTLGASGFSGLTNGTGAAATFASPEGITTDGVNLYVADAGNNAIRKIVISSGLVTTLAGAGPGQKGSSDGTGAAALFNAPQGITTDGTNLYVADTDNNTIRRISIADGATITLAGIVSVNGGFLDATGRSATFFMPKGITTDGINLYVSEWANRSVRKIVIATGEVTTLAGKPYTGMGGGHITTDGTSLYVSEPNTNSIRKVQ